MGTGGAQREISLEVASVDVEPEGRNVVQRIREFRARRLCWGKVLMEWQHSRAGRETGICKGDPSGPSGKRKARECGVQDSRRSGLRRWLVRGSNRH